MSLLLIDINFVDIIDVLLVGFIIYQLYQLTKGTSAIKIFIGLFLIYALWKIVDALEMNMLGEILGQLMGVGVIALIIVFQQELRQFLLFLGDREFVNTRNKFVQKFLPARKQEDVDVKSIVNACERLSSSKTGALIVIKRNSPLYNFVRSKRRLDAVISTSLLESIFNKYSPLHDGAAVIAKNRIESACGVLPVTKREDIPEQFGMRHRAALGLSEATDAWIIVVSEESGKISFVEKGEITWITRSDDLLSKLNELTHG